MIERFMVNQGRRTIGYAKTVEEGKELISRKISKNSKYMFTILDLHNEMENVDISDFLDAKIKELNAPKAKKKTSRPKPKRNDIIDDKYSAWLGTKRCVVTGKTAKRGIGINNMQCHHINGRARGTNDYEQVPLLATVHNDYHSIGQEKFIRKYKINMAGFGSVKDFFMDKSKKFNDEYGVKY